MASCPKCDGFSQRFNIGDLREYRDIVRQLIDLVNHGTFFLMRASCPLQSAVSYLVFSVMPGQSSVRNGEAGKPSLLKRLQGRLSAQAYRTATGSGT
jgi:hypothetical protein